MKYIRKGHIIIDEDGKSEVYVRQVGKDKNYPAINKAKKASRALQASGHTVRKG